MGVAGGEEEKGVRGRGERAGSRSGTKRESRARVGGGVALLGMNFRVFNSHQARKNDKTLLS